MTALITGAPSIGMAFAKAVAAPGLCCRRRRVTSAVGQTDWSGQMYVVGVGDGVVDAWSHGGVDG